MNSRVAQEEEVSEICLLLADAISLGYGLISQGQELEVGMRLVSFAVFR